MTVFRGSVIAVVFVCAAAVPAAADPGRYLKKDGVCFAGDEARQIAANMSYRSDPRDHGTLTWPGRRAARKLIACPFPV
jgi:hypothetical protein